MSKPRNFFRPTEDVFYVLIRQMQKWSQILLTLTQLNLIALAFVWHDTCCRLNILVQWWCTWLGYRLWDRTYNREVTCSTSGRSAVRTLDKLFTRTHYASVAIQHNYGRLLCNRERPLWFYVVEFCFYFQTHFLRRLCTDFLETSPHDVYVRRQQKTSCPHFVRCSLKEISGQKPRFFLTPHHSEMRRNL